MERTLRTGEYVLTRGADTEAERADAKRVLRNNGCRSVRFEQTDDGRLTIHGYVALMSGLDVETV